MLLAVDLMVRHTGKDFVDVECVAIASVLSFQSSSVYSPEFYTPQANRLATDGDTSLSEQILDVSMTEVKAEVQPDGITDDVCGASSRGNR